MGKKPIRIEWNYKGKPDFSSGTGAYPAEKILGLASAFVIPIFLLIQAVFTYSLISPVSARSGCFGVESSLLF